ncbi:NADP-dependent oxidoreductase [Streptomyces sp. NPDC059979]|uniref:NADP-dependent oxidoreductase n=1 Tax=unclassified Streptomyces TaxID=2593676 RepID=UPI0036479DD5
MRATVLPQYGEPEQLTVAELPAPSPAPGQILVRTAASAVNPVDLAVRSGSAAEYVKLPFPMVLGWDLSGVVEALGEGVTRFAVGDPVVAMSAQMATGIGTHAELVALDAAIAAPAPQGSDLAHAAALPLAGLTADQALEQLGDLAGSSLLITGGVGAVGGFAVQLAAARGARVSVLVRPGDEELARSLGADEVLTSDRPLPEGVFDAVLETAGHAGVVTAVRDGGRAVSIVPAAAPEAERGIEVRMSFVEQDGNRLDRLARLVEAGTLTLRVADVLDFADAPLAHKRLAAGGVRGKLLLAPLSGN